jgi:hypothetical protein
MPPDSAHTTVDDNAAESRRADESAESVAGDELYGEDQD